MEKVIEKELSYKLGGIFFKIHEELGRFCREKQYSDLFEEKLRGKGISCKREQAIEVAGRKSNFVDFNIEDRILIDFKAKPFIEKEDYYQMKRYLEVSNLSLGLIVNFRDKHLKVKRILNSKARGKEFVDSDKFVVLDRSRGFSVIELLVAISLFVIIISMSITIFLRALKTQKSVLLLMESNDNVALVIEEMAREIRSGVNLQSGGNNLEFTDAITGDEISYAFINNGLLKGIKKEGDPAFTFQQISANSIEIKNFRVILDTAPNYPPRATITFSVSPKNDALKDVTTDIQTTVSSRLFAE